MPKSYKEKPITEWTEEDFQQDQADRFAAWEEEDKRIGREFGDAEEKAAE